MLQQKGICSSVAVIVILAFEVSSMHSVSFKEDTTLTQEQSLALKKFKSRMLSRLDQDFMKEDIFLLRFIRAKDFNVLKAEEFLLAHLKWRKDNKIDTIFEEDWSEFEKEYIYSLDGIDAEGKPVLQWDFDEWDLRKAAASGQMNKLLRYSYRMLEQARIKTRNLYLEGKNVSRFTMIVNMKNINPTQHINIRSFPYYMAMTINYDAQYPGLGDKIYLINTPRIFEVVLAMVRPVMSQSTRDQLIVYGKNKKQWGPLIRKAIPPDQLPPSYGGTKVS